jgi:hypothetical protein
MYSDKSGQLMLISAFLLAIAVVAISLMLNNVIYANNMAYVGFMDQSKYDDISIKKATINEAVYASQNYANSNDRKKYMNDYNKSLNNITSMKGRYIDLVTQTNDSNIFKYNYDMVFLSIFSKNSKTSFKIHTGSNDTIIGGGGSTTNYHISLVANKTNMVSDKTDVVKIVATVTDDDTHPVSNFILNFNTDNSNFTIWDDNGNSPGYHVTDITGVKEVYFQPTIKNDTGTINISALIESATSTSNTITIT